MSATATAPKFAYNPDAPAWEPSAAALAGYTPLPVTQTETFSEMCAKIAEARDDPAAAASAAAAEPAKPAVKPIIISLDREVRLFPMREPRTKGIQSVLNWIGTIVTNGDESDIPEGFPKEKVYDYGCHYNDYRLESCLRSMPGFADPTAEELGDFPKNIQDYFWLDDGLKDEHPWRALCRLTTGLFVFVQASCSYSGFGCIGGIAVYAAKHPQTLVDHAMGDEDRRRFARIFNKPKGFVAAPAGSAVASQLNRPSKTGGGVIGSEINKPKAPEAAGGGGGGPKRQTPLRLLQRRPPSLAVAARYYPSPATVPKK